MRIDDTGACLEALVRQKFRILTEFLTFICQKIPFGASNVVVGAFQSFGDQAALQRAGQNYQRPAQQDA